MTFLKCTIRGEKHGETFMEEPTMEQEVTTGKVSRATSPTQPNSNMESKAERSDQVSLCTVCHWPYLGAATCIYSTCSLCIC